MIIRADELREMGSPFAEFAGPFTRQFGRETRVTKEFLDWARVGVWLGARRIAFPMDELVARRYGSEALDSFYKRVRERRTSMEASLKEEAVRLAAQRAAADDEANKAYEGLLDAYVEPRAKAGLTVFSAIWGERMAHAKTPAARPEDIKFSRRQPEGERELIHRFGATLRPGIDFFRELAYLFLGGGDDAMIQDVIAHWLGREGARDWALAVREAMESVGMSAKDYDRELWRLMDKCDRELIHPADKAMSRNQRKLDAVPEKHRQWMVRELNRVFPD